MSTSLSTRAVNRRTRSLFMRALLKALCLYMVTIALWGLVRPAGRGLFPTLYNHVFPGRTRIFNGLEFDAYRLVDDHITSQARSDTYNIVFLGSSEIWSAFTPADGSIPVIMDRLNMVTDDDRPVRVYNLAFPYPNAFKDLILLEVMQRRGIPIDMVILSTFDATLSTRYSYHDIVNANLLLSREVAEHYDLPPDYRNFVSPQDEFAPAILFRYERDAVRQWTELQLRGVRHALGYYDWDWATRREGDHVGMEEFLDTLSLDRVNPQVDLVYALAQYRDEQSIPLLLLVVPTPVDIQNNMFLPWLQQSSQEVGLPLLDCSRIFREPKMYEDMLHLVPDRNEPYAHILAQSLTDSAIADEGPGLPLRITAPFEAPSETCSVFPS